MPEDSIPRFPALQSTKHEDYFFHETEPDVFERKTLGFETMFILLSKGDLRFGSNLVMTAQVYVVSSADIQSLLREVWIQLRYKVPHIACTTHAFDAGEFGFKYTVPALPGHVEKWLATTLTFNERRQRHLDCLNSLTSTLVSFVSTGRYNAELFACPCVEGGYLLSLKAGHHAIDRIGATLLYIQLLDILAALVKGEALPLPEWGQEVQRLPPALIAVVAGSEDALVETARKAALLPPFEEPRDDMKWIPKHRVSTGSVSSLITVSREGTTALRRVSKEELVTVTDVLTSLAVLAQTNVALEDARRRGYFNETASWYLQAQNYIIPAVPAARIAMLPKKYHQSFDNGMPLLTVESTIVSSPMASIQRAVFPDSASTRVVRSDARSAISHVIQDVHQALKSIDYSRDATLAHHARSCDRIPFTVDFFKGCTPALVALSSLGDVQRFFKQYMTPLSSENERGVWVKRALLCANNQTATLLVTASQLNGSESVICNCGGGDEGAETMRRFVTLFIQYLNCFIGQDGAAVLSAFSVTNPQGDNHTNLKNLK
ncbi:hypothetical protein FISHEDRAFT_78957 [Fistulina hepatica ATCC 64428]|uniref:CoA-dependent acyltransferase n=1 Tax=Fistulina hepatica ATCC 64428 TaxID=1128425 RepID=A0A0D7A227_9AGAR|nr:hypothetical protein FISHEDRAFT_78957 [Fistulina hepatica ATCC 64428]